MSTKPVNRPLSPHLQVWKWTFTMALSILHRASGIALVAGMLMLVWMLVAAASSEMAYECFLNFSKSIVGQVMLFGWTGALYYHLCSGVRHLLMDAGYLLTIPQADKAGKIIFIVAIAMTLATWGVLKSTNGGM
ncbi:MAG: succinate dehydrogenase, cytochrome b556 subunit [Alphaproteobacteria bacterium RIFCSPHIGHO2_02_FULL_46_13]|nr:MAG: succinate dehydrogenase, cytochrome b556 subunit [Alphaproteobacteria bacterium RIFCSPHIGHO2_02_FULL_46_13]